MRLLFAIWAAKLAAAAGKLAGKKSSSTPGGIALKICPDLIERLKKNIKGAVIVTCGTNGKTTTNNLICTVLEKQGAKVLCNKLGANMLSGIANVFALECNIFGKFSADYACLEIDEASAVKVFDRIKPDYMVITNLFRDQLDRYGEIDITVDLLNRAIAKCENLQLILNGDDPLCAQFGIGRKNVKYYGVSEKVLPQTDETKEGRYCAVCKSELSYNYYHYSQLGDYFCPSCGNKRPKIDFEATNVNLNNGLSFTINNADNIRVNYRGFYNIYNILAVYGILSCLGMKKELFSAALSDYKPQIGRMEEINLGKPVILNLAKNPAGFNQAIMTVNGDSRKKSVIVAINDLANDGHDVSWLWDVDFEKLSDDNLKMLITTGIRKYDITLRFKYSDIKADLCTSDMKEAIKKCLDSDCEVVYILVNYTALFPTENVMLEMKKELKTNE